MTDPNRETDHFADQLEQLQHRVETLRQRAGAGAAAELLEQAMTELSVTVEELRVAEEELRQQADELQAAHSLMEVERRRYLDLFDFAPDGYLVTDSQGVIREANRAAAELVNRPRERLIGKPAALYVAPHAVHKFRVALAQMATAEAVRVWDTCVTRLDLPAVDVECTVAPARDVVTGQLLELRWRLHDISDRKRAQDELRASRESLRELSSRFEAVREEERTRIARAVHDEIGAALTAIKMDLARLRNGVEELGAGREGGQQLIERSEAAANLVDETMQTVRRISMEMRPAVLDDFGLVAALDWQLSEFQKRSGIECALSVAPGEDQLNKAAATAVYRVFQEILTNIALHAEATRVDVRLFQQDENLVLSVSDNGRGISDEAARGSGSMGLLGMHERVRPHGGTVAISGTPGEGTQVRVTIPVGVGRR
jgi:PAS domain S-box-containing protein